MKLKIFATGLLVSLIPVCGHAYDSYSEYPNFNEVGTLQCSTSMNIVDNNSSTDPEGQYRACDAYGLQGSIPDTPNGVKAATAPYASWTEAQNKGCASQRTRKFYISSHRQQNVNASSSINRPATIGSCRVVTVYDCNSCKSGYTKHTYDATALLYFSDSQTSTSTWSGLSQDGTDDYGNVKNPFHTASPHWHYSCLPTIQTCEAALIQECKTLTAGGSTCKDRYDTCSNGKCKIIHPTCTTFNTATSDYAAGSRVCVEDANSYWEACKLGYYRSAGTYDSANGWYKNITCTKCPATGMTTPATGSTNYMDDTYYPDLTAEYIDSAEYCYIPLGTIGSDATGTLEYVDDCMYVK